MSNLLDADPEFDDLDPGDLRALVSHNNESVLRRGRAMMELGRRASADVSLLNEVADMIRAPEYRQLRTVGTTSVAQLGTAGLVAGGGEKAVALARKLASEWDAGEQSDFAWLMRTSGVAWS
jgi:hypothetical protein